MRVKKIHIEIKSLGEALKEAGVAYEAVAGNRQIKKKSAVILQHVGGHAQSLDQQKNGVAQGHQEEKTFVRVRACEDDGPEPQDVLQDVSYLERLGVVEVGQFG